HGHGLLVGQAEALDPDEPGLRRDLEAVGEPGPGRSGGELHGAAARGHAAAPHVVAEAGEGQRLGDLGLGDVGAAAVAPVEVAVADELVEGGADGEAGDGEVDRELALGRYGLADLQRLDQVEHPIAGVFLLTHWKWYCPPLAAQG